MPTWMPTLLGQLNICQSQASLPHRSEQPDSHRAFYPSLSTETLLILGLDLHPRSTLHHSVGLSFWNTPAEMPQLLSPGCFRNSYIILNANDRFQLVKQLHMKRWEGIHLGFVPVFTRPPLSFTLCAFTQALNTTQHTALPRAVAPCWLNLFLAGRLVSLSLPVHSCQNDARIDWRLNAVFNRLTGLHQLSLTSQALQSMWRDQLPTRETLANSSHSRSLF